MKGQLTSNKFAFGFLDYNHTLHGRVESGRAYPSLRTKSIENKNHVASKSDSVYQNRKITKQ